jgi:hypothetical protein
MRTSGMMGTMKRRERKKKASPASLLAGKRWSKLGAEERRVYAMKMVEAKAAKRAERLKQKGSDVIA